MSGSKSKYIDTSPAQPAQTRANARWKGDLSASLGDQTSGGVRPGQAGIQVKEQVTCLHCWSKCALEDLLWVSEHPDLIGDPLLGDQAQLRFLANRFDIHGNAVDARGQVCRDIACPNCHLSLPRTVVERDPLFVSILGTPSCGKSYFLAALATMLRRELPAQFKVDISDADTVSNQVLIEYEEQIFLNNALDQRVALHDLIEKTQLQGRLYNRVQYGEQEVRYPRPFSFSLEPGVGHPNCGNSVAKRVLCLYDNAGEHFLPGQDSRVQPGTRHLAESSFIIFLFDPTQDPRWHTAIRQVNPASSLPVTRHAGRQEGVLREAASRVRRLKGIADGVKYDRPLIVVLNKADVWKEMLGDGLQKKPFGRTHYEIDGVRLPVVEEYSQRMRSLLLEHIPEIVYSAETFCKSVFYLPASALGNAPEYDCEGKGHIKPRDVKPWLVTLPFLLGVFLVTKGLIPKA